MTEIKLTRKHSDDIHNMWDEYTVNGKTVFVLKDIITFPYNVELDDFECQCIKDVADKAMQGIYLQQSTYTRPYEQKPMLNLVD